MLSNVETANVKSGQFRRKTSDINRCELGFVRPLFLMRSKWAPFCKKRPPAAIPLMHDPYWTLRNERGKHSGKLSVCFPAAHIARAVLFAFLFTGINHVEGSKLAVLYVYRVRERAAFYAS